jgi:hypothetical protein
MKKQVEDLALEKVGLPSKEIAAFVLKQFDRDYSGYSISYLPFLSSPSSQYFDNRTLMAPQREYVLLVMANTN